MDKFATCTSKLEVIMNKVITTFHENKPDQKMPRKIHFCGTVVHWILNHCQMWKRNF